MCGIVGIASRIALSSLQKKVFKHLLYLDVLRGEHSTGVAAILDWKNNPEVKIVKDVGSPSELYWQHSDKQGELFTGNVNILIGHNRYATQGKIVVENAHPFEYSRLVGVHNGTLPYYQYTKMKGANNFDVDSQILYNHLNESDGVIGEVWKKTDGAMSLVWFDKQDKALRFARNAQRPMYYTITEGGAVVWASEDWMIRVACGRCSVKIGEVKSTTVDKLLEFTVDDKDILQREEDLPEYERPPFSWQGYGSNYWDEFENYKQSQQKAEEKTEKTTTFKPGVLRSLIIKEVHKSTDDEIERAVAILDTGEEVKVNISLKDRKAAKEKILQRKISDGYYVSARVFKASVNNGMPYFVDWESLNYISLKEPNKVIQLERGFQVLSDDIPYYDGKKLKTKEAWEGAVEYGCDCCGLVPDFEDRFKIIWIGQFQFICKSCVENPKFLIKGK